MVRVRSPSGSSGAGGSASGHRPDDVAPYEPVPDGVPVPDGARYEPTPDTGASGRAGYDPVPDGGRNNPAPESGTARCVPVPWRRRAGTGRRARIGRRAVGSRTEPRRPPAPEPAACQYPEPVSAALPTGSVTGRVPRGGAAVSPGASAPTATVGASDRACSGS